MSQNKVSRRKWFRYAGAGVVVVAAAAGASYYATQPKPTVTTPAPTPTATPTPAPKPEVADPAKKLKGTKLNVVMNSAHAAWVGPVTDAFSSATGIDIEVSWLPTVSLRDKVMLELSKGTGAFDVLMLEDGWFGEASPYLKQVWKEYPDWVVDMIKGYWDDLFPCSQKAPTDAQGNLTGMAARVGGRILMYRKDLWEKNGLKLPPPTEEYYNWDNFLEDMKVITKAQAPETYGFGFSFKAGYVLTYCYYAEILENFGGKLYDTEKKVATLNDKVGVEALQYTIDMLHKHKVIPGAALTWDYPDVLDAQGMGKIGCSILMTPYCSRLEDKTWSKVAGKMGYGIGPTRLKRAVCGVDGGWMLATGKVCRNPEAAAYYIAYMSSPKTQLATAWNANGPVCRSPYDDPGLKQRWWWAPSMKAGLERVTMLPKDPEWWEISTATYISLNEALTQAKPPKQALDEAAVKIDKLLEHYRK